MIDQSSPSLQQLYKTAAAISTLKKGLEAVKGYHSRATQQISEGVGQIGKAIKGEASVAGMPGVRFSDAQRKEIAKQGLKQLGAGAAKLSPYAALGGGGVYLGTRGKSEEGAPA